MRKARVLPAPVSAWMTTSRPARIVKGTAEKLLNKHFFYPVAVYKGFVAELEVQIL